ncbi:MAG: PTS sugar transporter subunit IIA, partial [Oscillospiraceae bacterium]|nr:PTS sugar transporter subunit IIA [Oscillospiraceae bacterium]
MIKRENIQVQVPAADWQDAIRKAGQLLVDSGNITTAYIDAMIQAVNDMGPYIVIMPGFALAHAAPSEAVLETGSSLITLKEGVSFGSDNDPVHVIFCLACKDRSSHLEALEQIAHVFLTDGIMDIFRAAQSADDIMVCFERG